MAGDRSETAVQRIEAALARIAQAAEAPAPAGAAPNVLALFEKHESLRETVAHALTELDTVIAELEA